MADRPPPTATQALRALELHEARWQAILDTARDAIIGIDAGGRVTLFNNAAEATFGYAAAEVLGQNVNLLMPAPYRDEHDGYLADYHATRVPRAIGQIREVEGQRKSGEVFPVELSVSEARVGDDVMYSAIIRDVTERKRNELALRESEARNRAVLDTALWSIITLDEGGLIASFNPAAERLFGYTADEVIGQNVNVLMPDPYRGEHDTYLRRYLDTGERRIIGIGREIVARRKDGSIFPIELAVNDTILDGRHIFTGMIRDLTEQKETEQRERQLLKHALQNERLADIGAMTARIAHDFGNPLAGLQMTAERILRRIGRDPRAPIDTATEPANTILTTTKRLAELLDEFKEFAREQRLQLQEIDLPAFLETVITNWRHEAAARGVVLQSDAATAPLRIRADPPKLQRVMDNLVKNALEALEGRTGTIRLAAAPIGDDRVRILVEDDGPGLPPGLDAFAMFETTKPSGTGLGLSICRQIVIAHGGGIDVSAREPHGAVFGIELPRHGPRL